jgi:glycogen debranching enzyme
MSKDHILINQFKELRSFSLKALENNTVLLNDGPVLVAGKNQFRSMWTRDFCYAARGLIAERKFDVVKNHLNFLLNNMREDGLVPRTVDSMLPRYRVIRNSLRYLTGFGTIPEITDPLIIEYKDEHGTEAIDSNLLVILTSCTYVEVSKDFDWLDTQENNLKRAFHFYDAKLDKGLIVQRKFSDWQDSVKREGKTFYTNLLFWIVCQKLQSYPSFQIDKSKLDLLKNNLVRHFYDSNTGLFISMLNQPYISLEANLFAIEFNFDGVSSSELYKNLINHELWTRYSIPGFNTVPNYPISWRHLAVTLAGLGHYHDEVYWSWLMALSAKVAHKMGDLSSALKILNRLQELSIRDQAIREVYRSEEALRPWESWLFQSEQDFSWGSGMILDALSIID